jgi:type VI secretion system protein ImpC
MVARGQEQVAQKVQLEEKQLLPEEQVSSLDGLLKIVNAEMPKAVVDMEKISTADVESAPGDQLTAALRLFLDAVAKSSQKVEMVDSVLIDRYISKLDEKLNEQLNEILHHEKFQQLESTWRGLNFLVDRTDSTALRDGMVKIEILNVSKDELKENFKRSPEVRQSGLYHHVYDLEYDQPGGEPFAAMIANYEFDRSADDVTLLQKVSNVAAATHCPFIASIGHRFLGLDSIHQLAPLPDVTPIFEMPQYIKWNSFRESEDARYVGLVFPRLLLREPYDIEDGHFKFFEDVKGEEHGKYLWGNAAFAFASNLVRSFVDHGWCVQIRGPQAGGLVEDLPIHLYEVGGGTQTKIPTEIPIPDERELEFANLGFIPLSYYKDTDYACFFSANSVQKPKIYSTASVTMTAEEATASSRIISKLPYLFFISRLAHYLKVIQRENIGATKDRSVLQRELQMWINTLVTGITNPHPSIIERRPLREAQITVEDIEGKPGFFNVQVYVKLHLQVYVKPHFCIDPLLHFQVVLGSPQTELSDE